MTMFDADITDCNVIDNIIQTDRHPFNS